MENCVKVTATSPTIFTIITKNGQTQFETVYHDLNEWVTAIQSVAFKDDVSKVTSIEEDNDLYCSTIEGIFDVTLFPSDASKRCGLEPNKTYTLILTASAIELHEPVMNKTLYKWPYCYIRRYGYRSGKFTFEAGRRCESGEGVFHLEHSNQQQIFRCLSTRMKSMKKILRGESTNSLLDCGDNQFQAALSMEARSRSPLPPSPTSSTRVHDIELNSNQSSTKSTVTFGDNIDKERKPLPKPKPVKPPRKNINVISSRYEPSAPEDEYEIMPNEGNKYDEIEYRKEAWKTQGISDIRHTESVDDTDDLEEYMSWSRKPEAAPNEPPKPAPKIMTKPSNAHDEIYDKLQHFGSTSKLNSGYKQITPVAQPTQTPFHPSWSDYDEVEVNMQAVRLADDSHLGYGMIRKTPQVPQPKVTEAQTHIIHQVYNDNVYAVVSKPKQV